MSNPLTDLEQGYENGYASCLFDIRDTIGFQAFRDLTCLMPNFDLVYDIEAFDDTYDEGGE